jgi:hypothetical protein
MCFAERWLSGYSDKTLDRASITAIINPPSKLLQSP